MLYNNLASYLKSRYGTRVSKICIDGGFSCPNRDGTCGTGGCIYCGGRGAGEHIDPTLSIREQVREQLARGNADSRYIAYFQNFTNTYATVDVLKERYDSALTDDRIIILAIGTRPDCLANDVIPLLAELNRIKPICVELGLQTIHEDSARYIRRGYSTSVYDDAVRRLKAAGLEIVTHIIIGLPGEDGIMAAQTTAHAVQAGTDGVKFHLLHVLKNTDLEQDYRMGKFRCLEPEEYAAQLALCLKQLPAHITVHRITGDGAKRDLVAPLWSGDKKRILNYLNRYLQQNL